MITPAVSIMSAIEGLQVATPVFADWVVPISVGILVGLFLIQRHGTHRVGGLFGPVMVVWFLTIAILGLRWIIRAPEVLMAFDPRHAVDVLRRAWMARFRSPGRRRPGGYGSRSTLRGHGALRTLPDSSRVVRARAYQPF